MLLLSKLLLSSEGPAGAKLLDKIAEEDSEIAVAKFKLHKTIRGIAVGCVGVPFNNEPEAKAPEHLSLKKIELLDGQASDFGVETVRIIGVLLKLGGDDEASSEDSVYVVT